VNTYTLTYIAKGVTSGLRPGDVLSHELEAIDARHAAQRALEYERRSGNKVLTVKEKRK
jgi:hypothetical protein